MKRKLKIGLVGYGNAGRGFVEQLRNSGQSFKLVKVAVKREGVIREGLEDADVTANWRDITEDPSIDIIVEAISDVDEAEQIAKSALKNGKHFVTANKQLVVSHHESLTQLASQRNRAFLYEASCGAGIPLIRLCEQYYGHCQVEGFKASLNGTCNYILDSMDRLGLSSEAALDNARVLGYAESNATFDLSGRDTEAKLRILCYHLFGTSPERLSVIRSGIENLHLLRLYGEEVLGLRLIARARVEDGQIYASVLPERLSHNERLANLEGPLNGLELDLQGGEKQFISGAGAGSLSTGIGLFQDVLAISKGFRYKGSSNTIRNSEPEGELRLRILAPVNVDLPMAFFTKVELGEVRNSVRCLDVTIDRKWFTQLHLEHCLVLNIESDLEKESFRNSFSFSA